MLYKLSLIKSFICLKIFLPLCLGNFRLFFCQLFNEPHSKGRITLTQYVCLTTRSSNLLQVSPIPNTKRKPLMKAPKTYFPVSSNTSKLSALKFFGIPTKTSLMFETKLRIWNPSWTCTWMTFFDDKYRILNRTFSVQIIVYVIIFGYYSVNFRKFYSILQHIIFFDGLSQEWRGLHA